MNIATTGGNVTTFSGNLVANSQGANLVQWSNAGGGIARYTGDISGNLNGTVLFFRGGSAHEVLGNVNLSATSDVAITDNSTVLIGAAAKTYAWRNTTISYGTLRLGAANVLPATTAVTLGQNTGTASHLDLNGFNQTIGSLTATTNTATASTVTIAAGRTLNVNGDITLSGTVDGANTRVNMIGGGALAVNGANIRVGNNTGGTNISSKASLDLSALSSFTATLSGALTVQASGDNNAADVASLFLSDTANTITAGSVVVGGSATGSVNTLQLGGGTNLIKADNVRLGSGTRDSGVISFGATPTGTFTLRNTAGTGRANITMGNATNQGTGYIQNNVFDTTGHTVDLLVGTLTTAPATRAGNMTNTFSFDAGTLDIATINMAVAKGSGTSTNTINIGGGTVLLGNSGAGSVTLASAANGHPEHHRRNRHHQRQYRQRGGRRAPRSSTSPVAPIPASSNSPTTSPYLSRSTSEHARALPPPPTTSETSPETTPSAAPSPATPEAANTTSPRSPARSPFPATWITRTPGCATSTSAARATAPSAGMSPEAGP